MRKVLIANRGEIAVRVIRACHELGMEAIAIYADPDRTSKHTMLADAAYPLHGNEGRETYLDQDKIFAIAKESGADAIHPGYGFLSENPSFARRCQEEGIIFVGPPAEAIELMGMKSAARQAMTAANVPVTPGSEGVLESAEDIRKIAEEIGYPLLIKASSGGGGRGMRIVNGPDEVQPQLDSAQREAGTAFGDSSVYVERYVRNPKHIEIQILVGQDSEGVYLLERECSFQRKHQKVIEECPSPALTPEVREHMGQIALQAARACNYVNAGTVEFLFEDLERYYFMEMNTRIQVEHPITEMVTGVDLVQWQLRIAFGEELTLKQEDIKPRGWAVECRLNAEDPGNNFMPSPGLVTHLREPTGPGIRVDSGVREGYEISQFYDSMVGKLVAHGHDREDAIAKMKRALKETRVLGVKTNIELHLGLLDVPAFHDGSYSVPYLEAHLDEILESVERPDEETLAVAAAIARYLEAESAAKQTRPAAQAENNWKLYGRMDRMKKW